MDATGAVLLACGVQNLALAAALAGAGRAADRRVALALVVLAGMISVHLLGWTGRADPGPRAAFFPLNLPLALGPLLYGYVHGLARGRGPRREWLHFAPAAVQFAYLCAALAAPEPARTAWKEAVHDDWIKPLVEGAVLISLAAYAAAGLRLLGRYRGWLQRARSDADRYAGRWMGRVLATLLASLAVVAGMRAYTWYVGELESAGLHLWLAAWSAWLGVEAWRHAERHFPAMEGEALSPEAAATGQDWAATGARWRQTTQAEGWWREPELTLAELARRLGTNSAYLSRAVNEGLGVNFNAFINRMRAEEVARAMREDPQAARDLMRLALDAGFSSKATFNRAFRSVHGVSPSELRRRLES